MVNQSVLKKLRNKYLCLRKIISKLMILRRRMTSLNSTKKIDESIKKSPRLKKESREDIIHCWTRRKGLICKKRMQCYFTWKTVWSREPGKSWKSFHKSNWTKLRSYWDWRETFWEKDKRKGMKRSVLSVMSDTWAYKWTKTVKQSRWQTFY